jgi:hypothetical protein
MSVFVILQLEERAIFGWQAKQTGQLVWLHLSPVLILDFSGIFAAGKMAAGWAGISFRW